LGWAIGVVCLLIAIAGFVGGELYVSAAFLIIGALSLPPAQAARRRRGFKDLGWRKQLGFSFVLLLVAALLSFVTEHAEQRHLATEQARIAAEQERVAQQAAFQAQRDELLGAIQAHLDRADYQQAIAIAKPYLDFADAELTALHAEAKRQIEAP
jgi:hypothetical protein